MANGKGRLLLASCALAAAAVGVASATAAQVVPGLSIDVQVLHYDVAGSTAAELRRAMNAAGPREAGRTWFGFTRWDVRWRFRYQPNPSGCRMSSVAVEYTSRMTLPRWQPTGGADAALVSDWKKFMAALEAHEKGHDDLGAAAAREILRTLRSMRSLRCEDMTAQANATAHRVLDEFRARQRRYDDETDHGIEQGAEWPPRRLQPGWLPG